MTQGLVVLLWYPLTVAGAQANVRDTIVDTRGHVRPHDVWLVR